MNTKHFYSASLILAVLIVSCSFKQRDKPVDPAVLPGRYCHSHDDRDSIFVYADKTYKHTYHRTDGIVSSQTGTWYFKPAINDIFFDDFIFFNDGEPGESGYFSGTWPSTVFVTEEGEVKLRYSESVYYVKAAGK